MSLSHMISGGLAGTISASILAPFDVVKTRMQSSEFNGGIIQMTKQIMKKEGLTGFYRGLSPTLMGVIPAKSIYFYIYNRSKFILHPHLGDNIQSNALSATIAGFGVTFCTNPLWTIRTRLQLQTSSQTILKVCKELYKERGFRAFYVGAGVSTFGTFEGAIQFALYEEFKRWDYSPFVGGSVSKLIASALLYPHEVIRTRLRQKNARYSGILNTALRIVREEGYLNLYSGCTAHLMRTVPNAAIMLTFYELINKHIEDEKIKI
eukprot:NODE_68_length_25399_cov_0.885771.p10 type:complete len:264 gc:universal NODE_68_length_25399_cov_0.885771:6804-6013(-)